MTSLYGWLKFVHVLSVGGFLFVHGIAGGAAFVLRGPVSGTTRPLLRASQISSQASYPLLLLVVVTGVWMTFSGSWASRVWPWAGLGILIVTSVFMGYIARPYYTAREAAKVGDGEVATRLAAARPVLAAYVGGAALVLLFALMLFKPF